MLYNIEYYIISNIFIQNTLCILDTFPCRGVRENPRTQGLRPEYTPLLRVYPSTQSTPHCSEHTPLLRAHPTTQSTPHHSDRSPEGRAIPMGKSFITELTGLP